ncbi:acyl carrier protein [Listeria welshimeri]|nr:acyl carrier protein [Listeria welshimeri]MBC1744141.1 acyl carrier protein [Listeria welshimeri]
MEKQKLISIYEEILGAKVTNTKDAHNFTSLMIIRFIVKVEEEFEIELDDAINNIKFAQTIEELLFAVNK